MDIIQTLKERRSINFFDPEQKISETDIREIIAVANLSPSSFNLQPWELVAVTDPVRKKVLQACAFNQPKVVEASAILIVIANPGVVEKHVDRVLGSWLELGYMDKKAADKSRSVPFNLYGAAGSEQRRLFAVKNTAFFGMSIMIAAKGLGFETHPMDGFVEDMVKKEFHIPDDRIIPMLIALGYPKPDLKLLPRAFRREVDEFTRFNDFGG